MLRGNGKIIMALADIALEIPPRRAAIIYLTRVFGNEKRTGNYSREAFRNYS